MVDQPIISANKLAEFLISRPQRQRKIIMDRKYPDDYAFGGYYSEAQEAVTHCLADEIADPYKITQAVAVLNQKPKESTGSARRIKSNIDALEKFESMLDDIDFKGGTPELAPISSPNIVYHGVAISVRPEVIVKGFHKKGGSIVGAMKLSMTSGFQHNEESAGYVSALLQEHLRQHDQTSAIVHAAYCQVVDVGGKSVFAGVKSTAQRLKDIQAACQNIADIWHAN